MDNNNMPNKGRRAILLARCSTPQQTEYSVAQQIADMTEFVIAEGVTSIGEIRLEGVSGLDPSARTDIEEIVGRKRGGENFDAVVIPCVDRLTRGGPNHGFWICHEFDQVGIELISARRDLPPPGPYRWLVLGMKFQEANSEINSIVFRLLRGKTAAILDGRLTHTSNTPYGVDRLYVTPNGIPLHRIRNLADGTQMMLKPEGEGEDAVIRRFPKIEKKQRSPHYKRQHDEHVTYVPGDPKRVEVVNFIFEKRHLDGWGWFRIAKHLNDIMRTPAARGGLWHEAAVMQILRNPVYTGLGLGNCRTNARCLTQGKTLVPIGAPKPISIGRSGKRLKQPRHHYRDRADWIEKVYPNLVDYLNVFSAERRQQLREEQLHHHAMKAGNWGVAKSNRAAGGNRHIDSTYILSGLIRCKGDRTPLVARPTKSLRYYVRSRAQCCPTNGIPFVSVRADAVEAKVLDALQDALSPGPKLDRLVRETVDAVIAKDALRPTTTHADLVQQQETLLKQIEVLTLANADLGTEKLRRMTAPKKEELRLIEGQLAEFVVRQPVALPEVSTIIQRVQKQLSSFASIASDGRNAARVKALLQIFVQKLELDIETMEIEMVVAMPEWCVLSSEESEEITRLVTTKRTRGSDQTYWLHAIPLGRFAGEYRKGAKGREPALLLTPTVEAPER